MANNNIGTQRVLVIRISKGEIDSVTDEGRSVYQSNKGTYIKTVSDGTIYLDDHNRAVIAYRVQRTPKGYNRLVKYVPTEAEVEQMLHQMFTDYGLDGFIK